MAREKVCPPPDYRCEVTLLDGRKALIRAIRPDDQVALLTLFHRLSPETRFLRFHCVKTELTGEELERFCNVDYEEQSALVAEMCREGKTDIVGVGRYYRLPDRRRAEVAFVVEDREQMKGLGTHLLKELASIARAKGIITFVAELSADNVVMLSIFRKYDPALKLTVEGSNYYVSFSV
jgi:GNAT superfamily N-acetyltransferase